MHIDQHPCFAWYREKYGLKIPLPWILQQAAVTKLRPAPRELSEFKNECWALPFLSARTRLRTSRFKLQSATQKNASAAYSALACSRCLHEALPERPTVRQRQYSTCSYLNRSPECYVLSPKPGSDCLICRRPHHHVQALRNAYFYRNLSFYNIFLYK